MVCSNGATLGKECFALTGPCPDYAPCWLNMSLLSVNERGNVGVNISVSNLNTYSKLGDGMNVTFGDASRVNDMVTYWSMYSSRVRFACQDLCVFESFASTMQFTTTNASDIDFVSAGEYSVQSTGAAFIQSTNNGVQISGSGGSATWNVGNPTQTILGTAQKLFDINSPNFLFEANVGTPSAFTWISTNNTYYHNTLPGFTTTTWPASNLPSTLYMFPDIVMRGGATIIDDSDGFVRVSGLQSGRNNSGVLIVQNSTANTFLDVRSTIRNSDPTYSPVTIYQTNGVDFRNTPIYNTVIGEPLICNDTDGFSISPGVGDGTLTMSASTGAVVTLTVTGTAGAETLTIGPGSLTLVGPAANPISDVRVKQNITDVTPEEDLRFVLNLPRRVSYQHNTSFDVDNTTMRHGYIAQELEVGAPELVHAKPRTLRDGKTIIADFRNVDMLALVPRLAGALEAMYERVRVLEKELQLLRAVIK